MTIKTELQPHQQRVVERMRQQPGLVVAHGLGSGKTLTSIAVQEALGMPSDVVVPAALQANYRKEIAKHVRGKRKPRHLLTMQGVARGQPLSEPLLIVDEAHRARQPGTSTLSHLKENEAQKRLLLTGSPFYNRPSDISSLVNIASGQNTLPEDPVEFERRYVTREKISPGLWGRIRGIEPGEVRKVNPEHQRELKKLLGQWIDYHRNVEGFPEVKRQDVRVPMTPEQQNVHDSLLGKAPPWVRYKVLAGLPPNKSEAKQLNAFLAATRQASNTTAPFGAGPEQAAKIDEALGRLRAELKKNPQSKAVIYSNFLDAGVKPYADRLRAEGIPHAQFTGQEKARDRNAAVRAYNEGKIRALILSSAGGEGLDLKGTRLIQILEPHWNTEKLRQVEGRGIRFGSHTHLPADQRNVRVQRYLATRTPSGILEKMKIRKPGGSTDEYLAHLADEKQQYLDQFQQMLPKQAGVKTGIERSRYEGMD